MSGGATNSRGFWKAPPPRPSDYRVWNWLAVCYGAKATFYWCYLEESTGPEAGGFGIVRANGNITSRARSAAETAQTLRDNWPTICDYLPEPQVGVLYDPENSQQLFAMEATDDLYVQSHVGYYRALWNNDVFARYITYDSIQDLEGLKFLVIPMCLTLPSSVALAIRNWVTAGGVVFAEARTGLFDARGFNQPVLPSMGLSDVFGVVEEEVLCSDPDNRPRLNNPARDPWSEPYHSNATITTIDRLHFSAHGYYVPLQVASGEVIAHSDSHCLAVANQFGKGAAYYIGTYLGLALNRQDLGAHSFMSAILAKHVRPLVRGDKLRPRLIVGDPGGVLAVFNDSRECAVTERIELPIEFTSATDVYDTSVVMPIRDRSFEVEVEPDSVRVFRLASTLREG